MAKKTQCYSHYQSIIKIARLSSNWLDQSVDGNIPRTPHMSQAESMSLVRRSLQKQRKFEECWQLVKQEDGLYSDYNERALIPYKEFLECDWSKSKSEVIAGKTSFLRIFYAQKLIELGQKELATAELERAENSLRRVGGMNIAKYNPRLHLLIEITRAKIDEAHDSIAQIEQHLNLAMKAAVLGDRPIQRPELISAYRKADVLVDHKPRDYESLEVYELRQRTIIALLEFESEQTGSAFFLAPNLATLGLFAASNGLAASWFELFEDFRSNFPTYEIPQQSAHLSYVAASAAESLKDESSVSELRRLRRKHLANCPIIKAIGPDGSLVPHVDVTDTDYFHEWSPEFWPEQTHLPAYQRKQFISASILLRFIRRETSQMLIDSGLAAQIMRWDRSGDLTFTQWLEAVDTESLQLAIYGTPDLPTDPEEWDRWFAIVEPWLRRSDLPPSVLHRNNLLKEISDARHMSWSQYPLDFPRPISYHQREHYEASQFLRICSSIDTRIVRDHQIRTCKLQIASSAIKMALNPGARAAGIARDSDLAVTQDLLEQVAHEHRGLSSSWWLLATLKKLGTVAWIRSFFYKSLPDSAALKYLDEADDIIRQMLSQSQYLSGFQSYAVELAATDELSIGEIYRSGVKVAFSAYQRWCTEHLEELKANPEALLPENAQNLANNMVTWTQRAKARTTTNILGFNFTVPLGSSAESPTARQLLDREERLLERWNLDVTMAGKLRMKKEWQDLRQEMLRDDALKHLVAVQQGYSVTGLEINQMFQWLQEDVTFIDFVEVGLWDNWDLLMLVFRRGQLVACLPLDIKLKTVEDWITANLELDLRIYDLDDDAKFCPLKDDRSTWKLSKLAGLIKPLERFTNPGEVIVICPAKALHRIPLHALPIGDKILIERNPIVYCQSFTLLRLCFINRFENGWSGTPQSVAYTPLRNEVSTAAAVAEIAKVLGTSVETPDISKTPKEDFISKVAEAPLIHFHGHVRFDDTEPLKHHLELAAIREDAEGEPIPLSEDEILTAKDVFSLRILPGTHITTISCKSARARVTEANDLVGLGTAFHCAGAGSMISTLWNIHRDDGTRFSKYFYTHLLEQGRTRDTDGNSPEIVDMARAMQHAILKLRKSADGKLLAPYHWAGFVLNGAWQLRNIALNE